MKRWVAILFFAAACSGNAQTVANPYQVLHPIMKNPNQRNAPTSLNQSQAAGLGPSPLSSPAPAAPVAPLKPADMVVRIDAGLAVSPVSLIGTIDGLKGRLYITNLGTHVVTPQAQFAVCDPRGFQIGSATKLGSPLGPNDSEKMEVLATNLNAVGLKLMKLTSKK
jgi:hypothetical protein